LGLVISLHSEMRSFAGGLLSRSVSGRWRANPSVHGDDAAEVMTPMGDESEQMIVLR